MPTLRALECLVAVLEHGSLSRAATRLHLSQPALSHQLATLEREVGTALLERLPRGVRATTAGRAVAAEAAAALAASDRAVAAGRAVARGSGGTLRIACAESMTAPVLAPALRTWHRRHPTVTFDLTEVTSVDGATGGEYDLLVGPRPSAWTGTLDIIGTEAILVALAADDPLTASAAVTWADLDGRRIVHYTDGNGLGGWLDRVAAEHGAVLTAAVRTRHAGTAAQLAAAGLGPALVPATAVTGSAPVLRCLEPPLHRDVVAVRPNPHDRLAERFAADLRRRGLPRAAGTPAAPGQVRDLPPEL